MSTRLHTLFVGVSDDDVVPIVAELRRGGYEVSYLQVDALVAVESALAEKAWDVVIVDNRVTYSGTLEAYKQSQHEEDLPLIVLLGRHDVEDLRRAIDDRALKYASKAELTPLNPIVAHKLSRADEKVEERRRLEESLRESQQLYRTVVEQADEGIFLVDIETMRVFEANAALCRSLGYAAEELAGMTLYDIVAHDRETVDYDARRAVSYRRYFVGERQYRRNDGSLVSVEVSASRVSYGGRSALCIIADDVTERKETEQELQQSLEALLAIYEAGHILGSTLEAEEIGSRLLQLMQRISSSATAVISVPVHQESVSIYQRRLRVWQAVGFENLWRRARYTPEVQAILQEVMGSGEYASLRLEPPDPPIESMTALFLPLKIRNRVIGVLEVYGSSAITEKAVIDILVNLTTKAASALENARLYGTLAERERQLQELIGRLITAQEEERRRMAYEVHDGPTQLAIGTYQRLQAFARKHFPPSEDGQHALEEAVELARRTVGELRQIIANLRPTALDDFGLATAVRLQIEALRAEGWTVSYEEDHASGRVPEVVETTLYRVAQESLNNVRKHAGTTPVRVRLQVSKERVRLAVRDWGYGFESGSSPGRGLGEGIGLEGMRERVALVGGTLRVCSKPGVGTLVTANVPLGTRGGVHADGRYPAQLSNAPARSSEIGLDE